MIANELIASEFKNWLGSPRELCPRNVARDSFTEDRRPSIEAEVFLNEKGKTEIQYIFGSGVGIVFWGIFVPQSTLREY